MFPNDFSCIDENVPMRCATGQRTRHALTITMNLNYKNNENFSYSIL